MIIFLRDRHNRTLVDCEFYPAKNDPEDKTGNGYVELHSVVCIIPYTDLLVENIQHEAFLKNTFETLGELRGWLWEVYLPNRNTADRYDDTIQELRKLFSGVAHQINDLTGAGVFVVGD